MPSAAGGFSDVWKATGTANATIALKIIRVTQQDDFSEIKKVCYSRMHPANNISCDLQRFCKEVLVAKQVNNDNVLAIEGVYMVDESKLLCIVSEWMEFGNLRNFLNGNEVADRVELVSPGPHPQYPISDSLGYSCLA